MIRPVEHVRAMRGGAQSHLIRADDGHHYVVKFLNNPQHPRILANEWLASHIAQAIGLSVPACEVMVVSDDFIAANPGLTLRVQGSQIPVAEGWAFASRLPTQDPHAPIYDYLPEPGLEQVENLDEFAGALALDKWLCNCDGRQVIFCRPQPRHKLRAFFIDFGFCFNAGEWTFPDGPYRAVHSRNAVYRSVTGWDSFEPWLSRIESFPESRLYRIIARMPIEWHSDSKALVALLDCLKARRKQVGTLIHSLRLSPRAPFENWHGDPTPPVPPGRPIIPTEPQQRSLL
ncbi:MAG: HipA family kinase [Terriglobales bacterium]